ncbi:MAG: hypothetical protein ABJA02_02495 [Acidobacteriota bacterium]
MSDLFVSRERAENDLLAAAAYLGERIRSSDGRAEAMNVVVPIYLSRGEVDLAAELANSLADPYSRDKLLTLVAEKCAEIDDVEYAQQLADAVEDHGLRSQAYERIALARAGNGDAAGALEIAETMAHPGFVIAAVAAKQSENGDDASARSSLETIDFPTARVSAVQHIASTLVASDRRDESAEWLASGVESALEIEHDEEKIRALCEIGSLYVDAKRNDKAVETFVTARELTERLDNTLRDFFLGNCALGFLSAGSPELADQTLDLITDKTQMASALVGFARESFKKGETVEAIDVLEEAYAILRSQHERETRDSKSRNRLLSVIAIQFAGFGKTERAMEIAEENIDADERISALSQIAQILTRQNEDDLARQAINMIADDTDRIFAVLAISDEKKSLGDTAQAIVLLDEAADLAKMIPQPASRSSVLTVIASRYAGYGMEEKVREASVENLRVISNIRDESSQAAAIAQLAEVYGSMNLELNDPESTLLHDMMRHILS